LLLLDEPFAALDNEMQQKMQHKVLQLHRQLQLTTILVSHNISEIYKMSDTVILLENGVMQQVGNTPGIFTDKTANKFQFIGEVLDITREDIIYIVTLLVDNKIIKIIATDNEIKDISPGDKLLLSSKAFNPVFQKI